MAAYEVQIDENSAHRVEYRFKNVLDGHRNDEIMAWLNDPEHAGFYASALGHDYMTMTFLFSDPITAFEFKMLFC